MPLLQEERRLLQVNGAKHPEVLAIQDRIESTRRLLLLPPTSWKRESGDGSAAPVHSVHDAVSLHVQLLRQKDTSFVAGRLTDATGAFVFTNLDTARTYSRLPATALTYVLVEAAPGVSVEQLKARIERIDHVDAYTQAEMSARTRSYWSTRTGVGTGFFMTAIMGVIVGLVVVGQILYNGTLEHIKEYGTLKAMGAANGAIVRVIMYQALISAVVGFVAGGALAMAARSGMAAAILRVALSPELLGGTAVLTVVMCGLAALLSVLKVLRLDPAVVFKG